MGDIKEKDDVGTESEKETDDLPDDGSDIENETDDLPDDGSKETNEESKSENEVPNDVHDLPDDGAETTNTIDDLPDDGSEVQNDNSEDKKDTSHFEDGNKYKNLLPNHKYEVNGYEYETDSQGRIIKSCGRLRVEDGDRSNYAQAKAGGEDRKKTDDGGHLIARRFGGSSGLDNMVAMDSKLNRGDYKKLEDALEKAVKDGKTVHVKIHVKYDGDSKRPTSIRVAYTVDGVTRVKTFKNGGENGK